MKHNINKAECPEFDEDDVAPILDWANASVKWSDTFVNPRKGTETKRPESAHWSLVWPPGFIGFMSLHEESEANEDRARTASALFIYLWCKGVPGDIASHCAESYVNYEGGFDTLRNRLDNLPTTWYPALLTTLGKASLRKEVWKPGGLTSYMKRVEEEEQ